MESGSQIRESNTRNLPTDISECKFLALSMTC